MDNLINIIGGYSSWQFGLLLVFCLIGGSILAAVKSPYFVALQIFDAVLLIGLINHVVKTAPNLPSPAQYLPLACVAVMIAGGVWTFRREEKKRRKEEQSEKEKCQQ